MPEYTYLISRSLLQLLFEVSYVARQKLQVFAGGCRTLQEMDAGRGTDKNLRKRTEILGVGGVSQIASRPACLDYLSYIIQKGQLLDFTRLTTCIVLSNGVLLYSK